MPLRLLFLLLVSLAPALRATSVVPPSFTELVSEADAIYRGRVTAVQPRRIPSPDGNGSIIKTFVTFAVERVLKGSQQKEVTLEFFGGTLGDESMEISGMPKFNLGAREIVFVQKNGVQFCPLVALMHGRYRVLRDNATAREHIARDNGLPLRTTSEVELPMTALPAPIRAASAASATVQGLSADSFESSIAAEVLRTSSAATPH
jgi:hypothetical protein